jgi:hypothetical protein
MSFFGLPNLALDFGGSEKERPRRFYSQISGKSSATRQPYGAHLSIIKSNHLDVTLI